MSPYLIGVIIGLAIVFVISVIVAISKTKKYSDDKKTMEGVGPSIEKLSLVARKRLEEAGFTNPVDYSTAGYCYFEFKTKYHYEDNVHLVIDHDAKKIAYYQFVPFRPEQNKTYNNFQIFEIHKFEDISKVELTNNLGVINTVSTGSGIGTSIGGVAIGTGVSNSVASQTVTALGITVYFKDGKEGSVNFLNNVTVTMGDSLYNSALSEAKKLLNVFELIIKENEKQEKAKEKALETEKANENPSYLDELERLKKLLDQGIISQEEFDQKKKKLLGLE